MEMSGVNSCLALRIREKLQGGSSEEFSACSVRLLLLKEAKNKAIMPMAAGLESLDPLSCHISGHRISPRGECKARLQVIPIRLTGVQITLSLLSSGRDHRPLEGGEDQWAQEASFHSNVVFQLFAPS